MGENSLDSLDRLEMSVVLLGGPVLLIDSVGQAAFCKKFKTFFSLIKVENPPINIK